MARKRTNVNILFAFIGIISVLVSGGCIYDRMDCTESSTDTGFTIEFSMVTGKATGAADTRALIVPDNTEDGSNVENYLDLDNIMFLLLDDDLKLLRVFKPEVKPEEAGKFMKYSVRAFLNDKYFLDATSTSLTFSIAVVGNYSLLTPINIAYHKGESISDIFNPASVGTVAMPVKNNDSGSWIPCFQPTVHYIDGLGNIVSGMTVASIPMAGIQTFTVKVDDLKNSTLFEPYNLSGGTGGKNINMLRVFAKIEIVDKIGIVDGKQPDKDKRVWISKANLVGHTDRGAIFPTFDQWNIANSLETQYVTSPSLPTSAEYSGATPNEKYELDNEEEKTLINFFADKDATKRSGYTVFSCYLTEYDVRKLNGQEPMWVRLTMHAPGTGENGEAFYRLNVAPYTSNVAGEPISILRNNIYRYEITNVNNYPTELQVNWTVCPMDKASSTITFN